MEESSGNSILRKSDFPDFRRDGRNPKTRHSKRSPAKPTLEIYLRDSRFALPGVCVGGSCIAENSRLYLIIEVYRLMGLKKVHSLPLKPETRINITHFAKEPLGALFPLDTLRLDQLRYKRRFFFLDLFYSDRPINFGPEG